jgi:hypothetical protein
MEGQGLRGRGLIWFGRDLAGLVSGGNRRRCRIYLRKAAGLLGGLNVG